MEVKIDTKERFQVVSLTTACFSATMAAELSQKLSPYLLADVKSSDRPGNIVLNMTAVVLSIQREPGHYCSCNNNSTSIIDLS